MVKKYKKKDVIKKITYMIDPDDLVKEGIRVLKAYQRPREYIFTFFKTYHCGFSTAFNIGEAINIVTPESLPYIKASQSKSLFSYEWLILENHENSLIKSKFDANRIAK